MTLAEIAIGLGGFIIFLIIVRDTIDILDTVHRHGKAFPFPPYLRVRRGLFVLASGFVVYAAGFAADAAGFRGIRYDLIGAGTAIVGALYFFRSLRRTTTRMAEDAAGGEV